MAIIKLVIPELSDEKLADVKLKRDSFLLLDGQVYDLASTTPDTIKSYYDNELQKAIKQIKDMAIQHKERCDKLVSQAQSVEQGVALLDYDFVMKHKIMTSTKVIKTGCSCLKCRTHPVAHYTYYILPFLYAPKTVNWRLIKEPEKLRREVYIEFAYSGSCIRSIQLLNADGSIFDQYLASKGYGLCYGDAVINFSTKPEELPQLRNYLSTHLAEIGSSRASIHWGSRNPHGLPHHRDIVVGKLIPGWNKKTLKGTLTKKETENDKAKPDMDTTKED